MATQPSIDPAQLCIDPIFKLSGSRPMLTPGEVGHALCISSVQVRAHVDAGHFSAIPINDKPDAKYKHLRISRASVLGYHFACLVRDGTRTIYRPDAEAAAWRDHLLQAWKINETPKSGNKA